MTSKLVVHSQVLNYVTYKRCKGNVESCRTFSGTALYKFGKRLTDAWCCSTNHVYLAWLKCPFQVEYIGLSIAPAYALKYVGKPEKSMIKVHDSKVAARSEDQSLDAGERFLRGRMMSAGQAASYTFGYPVISNELTM